jgi:prophage regulatory protein
MQNDNMADGSGPLTSQPLPLNVFANNQSKTPTSTTRDASARIARALAQVRGYLKKSDAPIFTLTEYRANANSRSISNIEFTHAIVGDIEQRFEAAVFEEGVAELQRVGISRSYCYQLMTTGGFPRPVKVGRASRFLSAELDKWITDRVAERDCFGVGDGMNVAGTPPFALGIGPVAGVRHRVGAMVST